MSTTYALEIRKSDLALITTLNDGVAPKTTKPPSYLVFTVEEDGSAITSKIVTKREFLETHDIAGNSPLVLRLKS